MPGPPTPLSARFDAAVTLARTLHASQRRKGTSIPYVSHLIGVASLVLDDGGSEDEAIAALLHDAAEDQGGRETLDDIRTQFGERVAGIVDGCTDTYEYPKPPWKARKEQYIEHVRQTDDMGVLRVSLADKLHNARAIHFDLLAIGDELWDRFRSGRDEVLWYYETLADEFDRKNAGPMVKELRRTVANIRADSS